MTQQRHFHEELERLKSLLVRMAGLAEESVRLAVQALLERDPARAQRVIEQDRAINDLELDIDELGIQLLALQQPMARDLRLITMAMRISSDLERVGDHAVNIAEEVEHMVQAPPMPPLPELTEMVRTATDMLRDALDAFVRGDNELSRQVLKRDDRVDELDDNVFRILLTHMMENPRHIGSALDLVLISRNIERIADLATNIAEDVIFMVEGRTVKHHAEERETGGTGIAAPEGQD